MAYAGPASLNVRKGIPLDSAIVGTVKHGDRLEIIQHRRRFIKVRTPNGVLSTAEAISVLFNSGILADPADGAYYDYALAAPGLLTRARRIAEVCAGYDVPLAAAALRYVLRHPAVTAAAASGE